MTKITLTIPMFKMSDFLNGNMLEVNRLGECSQFINGCLLSRKRITKNLDSKNFIMSVDGIASLPKKIQAEQYEKYIAYLAHKVQQSGEIETLDMSSYFETERHLVNHVYLLTVYQYLHVQEIKISIPKEYIGMRFILKGRIEEAE